MNAEMLTDKVLSTTNSYNIIISPRVIFTFEYVFTICECEDDIKVYRASINETSTTISKDTVLYAGAGGVGA